MASQIPDLLSDSPPPELLSESTHSDLLGTYTPPIQVHATSPPQQHQHQYQHHQQQYQQPLQPTSNSNYHASDLQHHGYLSSKPTPPPPATPPSPSSSPSSSGFLGSHSTFSRMASSLTRRLTDPDAPFFTFGGSGGSSAATGSSLLHHSQHEAPPREKRPAPTTAASASASLGNSAIGFQTPPQQRSESPFVPPPLTGLTLVGYGATARPGAQLLNIALAEEIRLLLPPRLQLSDAWSLAFSVERDGVSLHTLYGKCASVGSGGRARGGWVLVVRDGGGSVFGAYLTDAPHPSSTYYGTGECFLWRASMVAPATLHGNMPVREAELMDLPPPPSEDTSDYTQRHVTLASPTSPRFGKTNGNPPQEEQELLRFKAFPYSGVNDYLIYCEADYLSIGGGDGKYGLWLDSSLEKGVSSPCMTFGNESLAEDGEKFDILGVEVWFVAA